MFGEEIRSIFSSYKDHAAPVTSVLIINLASYISQSGILSGATINQTRATLWLAVVKESVVL